ncbi:MAG: MaoC family dehydratase N-terminal domain-containing protein [Betaproteobacteria bacterium]|nr:MaoC family dehydratase N-terminal domain-containing protein [Betaproteobacteria bacterium]
MSNELDHLHQWVGKTESVTDTVAAWPVTALSATLDRDDAAPKTGDELPPGWHWLFFLEAKRASELGPDGHPKRGGFLPPVPLPRRMWAGGRIEFLAPLRIGDAIRRDSEILSVEPKHGRSGDLVFVTVRHTISAGKTAAVREEHDIVYRDAAKAGDAPPPGKPAPQSAAWQRSLTGDPVMLFRYSALTFNGHRIHYDLDYVKNEEHYPGLIVHGPLQTTLLLDLCRRHAARPVKKLDYRALHPVFHSERFTVNGNPAADGASAELWTANAAGNLAMAGTAYF